MFIIQQKIHIHEKIDDTLPQIYWKDFELYRTYAEVKNRLYEIDKLKQFEFRVLRTV